MRIFETKCVVKIHYYVGLATDEIAKGLFALGYLKVFVPLIPSVNSKCMHTLFEVCCLG